MKSHAELVAEIRQIVERKDWSKLAVSLETNLVTVFSGPEMAEYYRVLRDVDVTQSLGSLPKLAVAWLAFLCGDNATMSLLVKHISDAELLGKHELSFFISLKALAGLCNGVEERLACSKQAVDLLPEDDNTLFMANAKLTYAQILAGTDQYRAAAQFFSESYEIFYKLDALFPAAVALTNELLNRYRIGQFIEVIAKCNRALTMATSFHHPSWDYWNILHLPLGMCYFEMNKASLAAKSLLVAKASIDKISLFHMHGLIEYYLFKSYLVLKDSTAMENILKKATDELGAMQVSATEILLSILRILADGHKDTASLQSDIERLEVEYMLPASRQNWFLIEALAYLRVKGLSTALTLEDMVSCLQRLRYTGMIPLVQLFLVFLAEMNYKENNIVDATSCLEEVVNIFREYGVCVHLFTYSLDCLVLLKNIDSELYKTAVSRGLTDPPAAEESLLSPREKEILELIALGKNNEEIGQVLFISVGTIKWHINHILSKLEVRNRVEAVRKGKALGEIK